MKTLRSSPFMPALLAGVVVALSCITLGQDSPRPQQTSPDSGVNLAVVAEPSSSYVSGDTTLTALNDECDPESSRDRSRGSYGNWPTRGTQWVQYDLPSQDRSRWGRSPRDSLRTMQGVYKYRITPHWFVHSPRGCLRRTPEGAGNTCFWYRNDLSGSTKEFILVNAESAGGGRQAAFDHPKLAAALSKAAGADYRAEQLPFDSIEFVNDANVIRFTVDQTTWACDLASYTCVKTDLGPVQSSADQDEDRAPSRWRGPRRDRDPSPDSPDGRWTAFVRDNNVFVRARDNHPRLRGDGLAPAEAGDIRLSTDGAEGNAYGMLSWASDSKTLVAFRIEPGDNKQVYLIESSPPASSWRRQERGRWTGKAAQSSLCPAGR